MTHYNMRDFRTKSKLSQQAVALYLGVDRTTYGNYESGDIDIPFEKVLILCRLFGVKPLDFVNSDKLNLHDDTLFEDSFSAENGIELSPDDVLLLSERERVLLTKIRLLDFLGKAEALEAYIDSLLEKN